MKSEHRHELQTNELGKVAEKFWAFLELHGNRLMIGICVASLAASGVIYWVRTKRNDEAAAWREMSSAFATNKAEDFFDVWEHHQGTSTAVWARAHAGESWLAQGVEEQFRNIELGTEQLKKARRAFQAVVDDLRAPGEVRERALIGLGRTLESLSETAEAVKAYEMLVKEFPNSIYRDDADERIEVLKQSSGQEFYSWFSKFERPKAADKLPRDKFGESLDDDAKFLEDVKKLSTDAEASGLKPSTDGDKGPLLPPDGDEPDEDASGSQPRSKSESDDGKPQPKSAEEPESKSDGFGKPSGESKADES
jgi:hypothetical protein